MLRIVIVALTLLTVFPGTAGAAPQSSPLGRTPVVLLPAFHLTKLQVDGC